MRYLFFFFSLNQTIAKERAAPTAVFNMADTSTLHHNRLFTPFRYHMTHCISLVGPYFGLYLTVKQYISMQ